MNLYVLLHTNRFINTIAIRSRNKLTKTKAASGNGLSGLLVDVLFLPMVAMNVSSNSNSPTIITDTFIKALPRVLNASYDKIKEMNVGFLANLGG